MKSIFWHRRDLRIDDNAGLYKALKPSEYVIPIFIFDVNILADLPNDDQRVLYIYKKVEKLKAEYINLGSDLKVFFGNPKEVIIDLVKREKIQSVFTNRDYEPYALNRDQDLFNSLESIGVDFLGAKDHVVFEKNEVLKPDQKPYTIFTPYSKKWKEKLNEFYLSSYPTLNYKSNLIKIAVPETLITIQDLGFDSRIKAPFPNEEVLIDVINKYEETRDVPSINGTSRLSLALRFGVISIRKLARMAIKTNEKFLNELIWRDFYQTILYHFPDSVTKAFKPKYDKVEWINDEGLFKKWCEGKTGYPIVDAGMRELNETGFMHNRVRMITASFLVKHLLIDWRWGEAYFAEKLLDFELASNVGGWQWAASSGCDAAPYFRVFNPTLQQQKFDKEFKYIKKWVPEYGTKDYPSPIIEHTYARDRVLATYKKALNNE
jgi:deoxyribodipyrimidine photo-lyase